MPKQAPSKHERNAGGVSGAGLILVHGSNEFLVAERARRIVDERVPEADRAFCLEIVEGSADTGAAVAAAVDRALSGIRTPAFIGQGKVVWLRDVNFLGDSQVSRAADTQAAVERMGDCLREGLPGGHLFLISALTVDQRKRFFKLCQEVGAVEEFQLAAKSRLHDEQVRAHIAEEMRKRGVQLSADAMSIFVEKSGGDFRQLMSEIDKLAAYAGASRRLSREDVERVASASRDTIAWDLADAVGHRNLRRALEILRRLLFQREAPIALVAMLHGRIRELMLYREALDRGWLALRSGYRGAEADWGRMPPDVDARYRDGLRKDPRDAHPFRMKILAEQAAKFSMRELRTMQRTLVETHAALVSSRLPPGLLVEMAMVKILS